MRLGLVTGEFPPMPGGIGDYTAELARSLAARGSEVHVIAPTSAAGAPAAGWTVHPVVRTWSLGALLRIRRLARRLGLQALLVEYQAGAYRPSAPIHFLPTVAGVPTFTTFHDLLAPHLFPLAGRLRRDAITFLARSSTGVIVADPADEDELHRRGIADVARIPIGSNIRCAPPADFDRDALRARYGVAPADALVGHFGFLHPSKGADDLVLAIAELVRRGVAATLVFVGDAVGNGDATTVACSDGIDRLIREQGLAGRVLRSGPLSPADVSAHLLACDVLVLPYRDGVSFRHGTLMAAFAHGCPVVTTLPPVPAAEWCDGGSLRLVPVGDVSAIASAVQVLLADPGLRARTGRSPAAFAERFGWDSIAEWTLDFVGRAA